MAIQIENGIKKRPQKVVIYAPEGAGKTTIASQMPSPLFADTERGSDHIDLQRVHVKSIGDFRETCLHLIREPHNFKSFVVDTIDWLAAQDIVEMLKEDEQESVESYGYGKGYKMAEERFMSILHLLDRVSKKGIHVVLLAHSKVSKFEEPDKGGSYDRYSMKLEKKVEGLVKEWCDALLFMNFETRLVEKVKGQEGKRAIGGVNRIIHCTRTAAYDAKNRHGMPDKIKAEIGELAPIFSGTLPESKPKVEKTVELDDAAKGEKLGEQLDEKIAEKAAEKAAAEETVELANDTDEAFAVIVKRAGGREAVQAFLDARDIDFDKIDPAYRARVVANGDGFAKQVAAHSKATATKTS